MATPLILLVDDEPHITHVLARAVRAAGFEVETAEDGAEAFEMASEMLPSLIVTDLQMPYMSGIELAEKLKERPELASIPVILLSARSYAAAEAAVELGNIRLTIEKPFSAKTVVAEIVSMLAEPPGEVRDAA